MIKLSIIIPTYNRADILKNLLESIAQNKSDLNDIELIIVDNNSKDNTKKIINQFKKLEIKYVFEEKQGLSISKNTGFKNSNGKYITYLDDDSKITSDWIRNVVHILKEDLDIFGGKILPYYNSEKPKWFKDEYASRSIWNKAKILNATEFLSSSNMIIKRTIFEKLNGFNPSLGVSGKRYAVGEETDFQKRARNENIVIHYFPELEILHLVAPKLMNTFSRIKTTFLNGFRSASIFMKGSSKIKVYIEFNKNFLILIIQLFLIAPFFRNRSKYKFIQNYIVEVSMNKFHNLGSQIAFIFFNK